MEPDTYFDIERRKVQRGDYKTSRERSPLARARVLYACADCGYISTSGYLDGHQNKWTHFKGRNKVPTREEMIWLLEEIL